MATAYGEVGVELLRQLKRAPPHSLPPFNGDAVREVVTEFNALFHEIAETLEVMKEQAKQAEVSSCIILQHAAMLRDRRCLLAYLNERLNRLKYMRWEVGQAILDETVQQHLSKPERDFYEDYNRILSDYQADVLPSFDPHLTGDLQPPKQLKIEVRCVEDIGEIILPSGTPATLSKNSQHFLLQSDVEQYVRQGLMEHILSS